MNEEKLNQRLKEYYHHKKLPDAALARMKRMIEKDGATHSKPSAEQPLTWRNFFNRPGSFFQPGWAVAFACCLIVGLVTWQTISQNNLSHSITQQAVLKEITMNHKKNLTSEFKKVNILTLGSVMPKLDFTPVIPKIVTQIKLKFMGARYCAIYGNLAVQLKFETPSGNICTLYQTASTQGLSNIKEAQMTSEGVDVRFWNEKGLFMAMAGILK